MMTPNDLSDWVADARPGQRIEYHRGLLALDRDWIEAADKTAVAERKAVDDGAQTAWRLAVDGVVMLSQERVGPTECVYYATKTADPVKQPRLANFGELAYPRKKSSAKTKRQNDLMENFPHLFARSTAQDALGW